jgi:hypothetical protein
MMHLAAWWKAAEKTVALGGELAHTAGRIANLQALHKD